MGMTAFTPSTKENRIAQIVGRSFSIEWLEDIDLKCNKEINASSSKKLSRSDN